MSRHNSATLARDFESLFGSGTLADLGDGQLLDRFITGRDAVAFEELIGRHGPVVLGICRRSLADPRDIEDAFQAIFLILVRKAASLRDRTALSSWLYGVALRVARRARGNTERRRLRERPISAEPPARGRPVQELIGDDVRAIVDQEIRGLPETQQIVVILCLIEGFTHEVAASKLGWPLGTVKTRIADARRTLRHRLARRGLAPSALIPILESGLRLRVPSGSISPQLVRLVLDAAERSLAAPSTIAATTSTQVARLVHQVLGLMVVSRIQSVAWIALAIGTLGWAAPALLSDGPTGTAGRDASRRNAPTTGADRSSPARRMDGYGDPLPPGAVMRLGTVRFRNQRFINHVAYSPDGRFVVTDDLHRMFQCWDANDGKKVRQIESGLDNTRYFAFSPDGKFIAAVGSRHDEDTDRMIHGLTLTDAAAGRLVRRAEWNEPGNVRRIYYTPDGKMLAIPNDSGSIQLRDAATLEVLHRERVGVTNSLWIAVSPDPASHLLAIEEGQSIRLWDVSQHRDVRRISIEDGYRGSRPVFSPDGATLAAEIMEKGMTRQFWLWKVGDGTLLRRLAKVTSNHLYATSFSPDGKVLAAIGDRDRVLYFNVATGQELPDLADIRASASPLVFSPDGRTLTTLAGEQTLHFWDRSTGKDRLATPDAHSDNVRFLAFLDGGRTLVSGSYDGTLRFWDLATGRSLKVVPLEELPRSMATSADGTPLATSLVGPGPQVRVWNVGTGRPVHTWSFHDPDNDTSIQDVTLSRDASTVTARLTDGSFRSWDVASGNEVSIVKPKSVPDREGDPSSADRSLFSPDGRSFALTRTDGTLQVIDTKSGAERFRRAPDESKDDRESSNRRIEQVEFAPDGHSLAMVKRMAGEKIKPADGKGRESSIRTSAMLWLDSQTGQVRREIRFPESSVGPLAFSPDGQLIAASTSRNGGRQIIRIYRLRNKKEVQTIETPSEWVTALAFTPDGTKIVAGLWDTSIVAWDVRPTE